MKRSVTKKPKLTQWFDGSVKPVRDGVYQRRTFSGDVLYWQFKDGFWRWGGAVSAYSVVLNEPVRSNRQNLPWRGLAQKPEVQP